MPKRIAPGFPNADFKMLQKSLLAIDESILDELLYYTPQKSTLLMRILPPEDDFIIQNEDIPLLNLEISQLISNLREQNQKVSPHSWVFLYSLSGFCTACVQIGSNLVGYAD